MEKLQSLLLKNIRVDDPFWSRYTALVPDVIIPYQWEALNDRVADAEPSHAMANFRIAAGLQEGSYGGAVFQDTDLAKWLEAAAFSLSYRPDPALEQLVDEAVELIAKAQQPDGYINTHFTIAAPQHRWGNLREGHELYTAGHLMEAAVAYYKVTGKTRFLEIMQRFADLICQVFHTPEYRYGVPGHQEVEIGLVKLAEATGCARYMEMARDFIERRGGEPNYLLEEHKNPRWLDIFHDHNAFDPQYSQCHLPVRQQTTAEGHAVRAVYMYCAMADIAAAYDDESLLNACKTLWDNIVGRRMFITGGIGSSGAYERFTTDYDLPNSSNYSETCASIGLALFGRRMAQITRNAAYMDEVERALYNTVLSGIAMDGKSFFYVNPLEVWPDNCLPRTSMDHVKAVRQRWFGVACCPPNIARTLASLGEYIYFVGDSRLWVNLYVAGTATAQLDGRALTITQTTRFPFEGESRIMITAQDGGSIKLALRIPSYATDYAAELDGQPVAGKMAEGYLYLDDVPSGSQILLRLDIAPRFVYANPRVRADAGRVAVQKGPLVYCLEEADNGPLLAGVTIDTQAGLQEQFQPDLLGGVTVILAGGQRLQDRGANAPLYSGQQPDYAPCKLQLVPYCRWGNRQPGEMLVWMNAMMKGNQNV